MQFPFTFYQKSTSPSLQDPTQFHPLYSSSKKFRLTIVAISMEAGIGLMGTKLGMMSYFEPDGIVVPVTVVAFREGNIVTQIKSQATDGYDAVPVGYRRVRDKKLTKPELGHLEKAGVIPMRHLQEFRLQNIDGFEAGQKLVLGQIFKGGDLVDVSGTTIGKGFQGGIKRHKIKRGQMTMVPRVIEHWDPLVLEQHLTVYTKGRRCPVEWVERKRKLESSRLLKLIAIFVLSWSKVLSLVSQEIFYV